LDINTLGTVQTASANSSRPRGTAKEALRAAAETPTTDIGSARFSAPTPAGDNDAQPDPSTPRGSLLDITA